MLLGVETDTYDVLGIVNLKTEKVFVKGTRQNLLILLLCSAPAAPAQGLLQTPFQFSDLIHYLKKYTRTFQQRYPLFSSKPFRGKALHEWGRQMSKKEGEKIDEEVLPSKEVTIYSIEVVSQSEISVTDLIKSVRKKISFVKGNFRQEKILDEWQKYANECDKKSFNNISNR